MPMTVPAAPSTQAPPASRQASGAIRSSMKYAITSATLTAASTMTARVETVGATASRENHHVDAAVFTINTTQTTMAVRTAELTRITSPSTAAGTDTPRAGQPCASTLLRS